MQASHKTIIHIDHREYSSQIPTLLEQYEHLEIVQKKLSVGDYHIGNQVIIERKTLVDLCLSIQDRRLFEQTQKLSLLPCKGILLLEGSSQTLAQNGMSREAIQGALIHLTLFMGIAILRSLNKEETANIMATIAKQLDKIENSPQMSKVRPKRKVKKYSSKQKSQKLLLQNIQGIGASKAQLLLDKFGSLEAIFQADEEDLMNVLGIGAYTAQQIKWILKDEDEEYGF
jgi:DNA excision repair protein ERCC-4